MNVRLIWILNPSKKNWIQLLRLMPKDTSIKLTSLETHLTLAETVRISRGDLRSHYTYDLKIVSITVCRKLRLAKLIQNRIDFKTA
jgi:hypothetical protein